MTAPAQPERHALVTGAARGIGAAIARALLEAGARVTLVGRDLGRLEAAAGACGGNTQCIALDVTAPEQVATAFARAADAFGPIEWLVNNAGQAASAPFHRTDGALLRRMLDVNLLGPFHCIQAALPAMLERNFGRIVTIASTAALVGYPYVSAYAASKHGVVGLTRSLALGLAAKNITVNAVCPGYTETDMSRETMNNIRAKTGRSGDEARMALVKHNPQRRMIEPREVANAVLWLCRPGAESITGQSIAVAGGEVT